MKDVPNINRDLVVTSFGWRILERVFNQGGGLLVQIVLARLLMPDDFGSLAIIMAVVNYCSMLVQSGMSTALIQRKEINQLDIDTVFSLTLFGNVVLYIGIFFLAPYLASYYNNMNLVLPIRVTSLVLFLYSYNSIQAGLLSRVMDFKVIFYRSIISVPISGAISIVMAYYGFGIWALIANVLLGVLLSSIVMGIGTQISMRLRFSMSSAKNIYSYSIKILGASIISGFSDLFRTMSIGKKYSASDLAYYDKAYTYSLFIMQVIYNSIQSVLFPVFSRKQDDIGVVKEITRLSVRITMFGMFPILLGLIVVSRPAVLVLLTEKWESCIPFLMLFSVFRISGAIVGIDKQVILALGKSSIIFYFEMFLFIANIIMLCITIPISVAAIAIGATIVEYVANIGLATTSQIILGYSLFERLRDLALPFFNSCIMMGAMWLVSLLGLDMALMLIVQIIIGFFTYFIMSWVTKDDSLLYIFDTIRMKFK